MSLRLALILFLPALVVTVGAEPLASIPNPRVKNGTWVIDMPGALRPDTEAQINQAISATEKSHGVELAVVVVQSLDGLTIEDYAVRLFKAWGIGKKDRDNGLLFLWSTGDRQVKVEVGYGLEGVLPDGKVGAILDTYVVPKFKTNEFDAGVIAGVDALLAASRNEAVALPLISHRTYTLNGWLPSWWPIVPGVPLGIGALSVFNRWRRYRRRRCPKCQARMTLIPDYEDDAMLAEGQVAEERVGSVDYDVWKCPSCAHHFTLRYAKWTSKYDKCPQCFNHTKSKTESVTEAATTSSEGIMHVIEQCAFCSFTNEYDKTIPRVRETSSSSSSSDSSWGGSSGGGSSFGGGSSGGGGASRSY